MEFIQLVCICAQVYMFHMYRQRQALQSFRWIFFDHFLANREIASSFSVMQLDPGELSQKTKKAKRRKKRMRKVTHSR